MAWVSTNELVQAQIDSFKNYADTSFNTAIDALNLIASTFSSSISAQGLDIGIDGSVDVTSLPTYVKPVPVPEAPEIEFDQPASPGEPLSRPEITNALLEAKARLDSISRPTFTDTPLPLQLPSPPSTILPDAPGDPAPIISPVYPDALVLDKPGVPAMRTIMLPTLDIPDLSAIEALIAALRAAVPVAPVMPDSPDFGSLTSYYYTLTNNQLTAFVGGCAALASICPRLTELLSGTSTGLPATVEQALRDRAFAAEDRQAFQAEQEATTDWLARGFTLPGGVLEAKLATIRQLNRDKKAQINREVWIEAAKFEVENLRFAVQQGIAYESMLRDSWGKLYGIVQAMAQTDIEVDLKILDSAISLYKVKVEAWQVEFATIKDQLQIELAKLEIYKSELEGQKLVGQLNQQDIELFKTRWDALGVQVNVYKTQVDAANSLLQAELAKLEYSAKLVSIYSARIGAYEAEWKAYSAAAEAEKSKTELFESQSRAFASRVAAYASEVDAAKTIADLDVTSLKLQLEAWQSQLEQYKAELQTELGRIDSVVKGSANEADIYKTKALVESGYTDFEMKKLEYSLGVDRLDADITLKEAELTQNRELFLMKTALDALDGIARTGSQLAGSAMSAMNVQASLGSSSSTSDDYNENHNYSYEM
jgi:hypothetical protein